jgi:hypothetical protein
LIRTRDYQIGYKVLLKKENWKGKLDDLYMGPFEITDCSNPNVETRIRNRTQLVHKKRLKPFISYLHLKD